MAEDYRIQLGVDLKVNDIRDRITKYNQNKNNAKLKLGIKLDTEDLKKQINQLNLNGKNAKGIAIPVNTASLELSLAEVKGIISDIKNSLGALDAKSGMKNLLSSVNQIADALGKATKESETLVNSLNALSKKDFSFNFNLKTGNSNPIKAMTDYGQTARRQTIPALQEQAAYLRKLLGGTDEADKALEKYLVKLHKGFGGVSAKKSLEGEMVGVSSDGKKISNIEQMAAYEKYIGYLKEIASLNNINLDGFNTKFSKAANELVDDTVKIQSGVKEAEEQFERLKGIFGGIDAEGLSNVLEPISKDLADIRKALESLSSIGTIDGLTTSFKDLSEVLDKLVSNITLAKNAFGDGLGASISDNGTQNAIQEQNELAQTSTQTTNTVVRNEERKQQAYRETSQSVSDITQLDSLNLKDDITEADRFSAALSKLKNIQSNIGRIDIGKVDTSKGVQELQVLENQLESLSAEYNETVAEINGMGGVSATQLQTFQNQAETTKLKLEQLEAQIVDTKAELAKNIKTNFNDGDFNVMSRINAEANKLTGTYPKLTAGIREVEVALREMELAAGTEDEVADVERLISAHERYEHALKNVNNQLRVNLQFEKSEASAQKLTDDISIFQSKIDAWLTKNSAAAKKFGSSMLELKMQAEGCDRVTLNHLKSQFKQLDKEAEAAGLKIQTFDDRIKTQFSKYSSYFSVASVFMYGTQALRSMFEQVKLIDSAMTELKKVTNETDASYNKFLKNAATRSKEIGTTIDGLVSSTADFARLGYGFEDAQGLAEVANIYAVVGDEIEGVEGATESLISTMAAFKDEMNGMSDSEFAMSIIDKFNEIGNNFAISSGGIGEALERSASSLMAANNTIDESIALITAANTVVQDPEAVGEWLADIKSGYIG